MALVSIYLSLGSNLGDRRRNLETALALLDDAFGARHLDVSGFLETEPWGFGSENRFLNACALYRIRRPGPDAETAARRVLEICKETERRMGRTDAPETAPDGHRIYRDRPIDIDILFFGRERIGTEDLTIPHPLIRERDFVLVPLREIARPSLKRAFPEYFRNNFLPLRK